MLSLMFTSKLNVYGEQQGGLAQALVNPCQGLCLDREWDSLGWWDNGDLAGVRHDNAMDSLHQLHTVYSTSAQIDSILHTISKFRPPLDLAPAIQANARPPIGFPPESDHPGAKSRQDRDGLAPPGQLCAAGTTESGNRDISLRAIYIRTGCRRQSRRATLCRVQAIATFRLNCQVPSPARNKYRRVLSCDGSPELRGILTLQAHPLSNRHHAQPSPLRARSSTPLRGRPSHGGLRVRVGSGGVDDVRARLQPGRQGIAGHVAGAQRQELDPRRRRGRVLRPHLCRHQQGSVWGCLREDMGVRPLSPFPSAFHDIERR